MRLRFARVVTVMGIAAACGSIAGFAQTPSAPTPAPTGLIVGRVVDAAGGAPISGAVVMITGGAPTAVTTLPTGEVITSVAQPGTGMSPGSSAPRQVITDSDGRFLFRELGKGRHTIRVNAAGYLPGASGQNRPGGTAQPVELAGDAEKIGGIVVRMWKGAAMSGTITDEAGEPVDQQMPCASCDGRWWAGAPGGRPLPAPLPTTVACSAPQTSRPATTTSVSFRRRRHSRRRPQTRTCSS